MGFIPFDQYQREVNERYYSEKGAKIYDDFATFAHGNGKLAQSDARGFYERARKLEGELRVCEFGVGNGFFARAFLDELKRIDLGKKTDVSERTVYSLVDFSEKMIDDARKNLAGYNVETVLSDSLEFNPGKKFHYARANELLSDLPSKLLFAKGDEVFELGFEGEDMASRRYSGKAEGIHELPEGYLFPLNIGAMEFIWNLEDVVAPGGYADIFDYGFRDSGEAFEWERPAWNDGVSRWYGEQVTVDVNFFHLKKTFPKITVEPQKEYTENALGEKLFQVELKERMCYLGRGELSMLGEELGEEGYPEEFASGEFEEESDFWHARVSF